MALTCTASARRAFIIIKAAQSLHCSVEEGLCGMGKEDDGRCRVHLAMGTVRRTRHGEGPEYQGH